MKKLMDRLYDNLDEAKAFALSFTNFAYFYDDFDYADTHTKLCEVCGTSVQHGDYQMPRASAKKPTAILHSLEMGVCPELREELIARFNITEKDFRPIRTKRGELVYYQITPQHVMLPLHEVNGWPIWPEGHGICPKCGNIRYDCPAPMNEKKEEYHFITQEALDDMHDLNVTCERIGNVEIPLFIISRRVYEYLTECYPRTHYFPFFLKEENHETHL